VLGRELAQRDAFLRSHPDLNVGDLLADSQHTASLREHGDCGVASGRRDPA
jgi:hypothetical protein